MQGVKHRLQSLGFDLKSGRPSEMPQEMEGGAVFMGDIVSADFYRKWMSLYSNIQSKSIKDVAEEAAYTWFNRLMAIRIMAKQEFITPVLAYESEDIRVPVIVSDARKGRLPHMSEAVRSQLMELLDDDNKTNEQFALLIVAYCHENPIINNCFGAIADYTELLLPQNILSEGGFVDMINHTDFITDEQYASAELIGWLYQFYISDRKDEAFAKKGKYDADEIAPATQIFTPNWIVKYMAENTLGRIYIDNNPYCDLKDDLKYLVDAKPSSESLKISDLSELKVADLACGSGHILNECFDLLYKMYVEEGYSRQQAIRDILQKNIIGIDLDTRAKQLATFALLMKACQKDQSFLDGKVMPRIYDMPRPIAEVIPRDWGTNNAEAFLRESIPHYMLGNNDKITKEITEAILLMDHADTLGSIMKFKISDATRNAILVRTREYEEQKANEGVVSEAIQLFIPYMNIILALTEKYAALCMNPPYMGSGRFDNTLSTYVKRNYPRSKADLFAVFMDVAIDRLTTNGKYGMINMHSWMFLSSFENLRKNLLDTQTIDSLLHLGPRTFDELSGEVVQNAAFVISKYKAETTSGTYFRLLDGKNSTGKESLYLSNLNSDNAPNRYSAVNQFDFKKITGYPFAYWISSNMLTCFDNKLLETYCKPKKGLDTPPNEYFLKLWHEISNFSFGRDCATSDIFHESNCKWAPVTKGGHFRKWYGNNDYVLNWSNNGEEVKANPNANIRNEQYYFNESLTWTDLSSGAPSFRYNKNGFIPNVAGPCIFDISKHGPYLLALLNSRPIEAILKVTAPTMHFNVGAISSVPFIPTKDDSNINRLSSECIEISKKDWDAHETSWDFQTNELLRVANNKNGTVEDAINSYRAEWERNFEILHENEEELNRQFIDIYGLQDEITPDVPLSEITILQAGEITHVKDESEYGGGHYVWNYDNLMKQLISYAVGCMMGRYSIDKPGLILANQGEGVNEYMSLVPDSRFDIDDDGIIPLMASDTDFSDNATNRFKQWLAVAFGEETLVQNLNFIEGALGKSIDSYFVKDFWKDHKKMYQNRPIYWLFSSKKGAFQCLAYMHRMTPYTAELVRTKYLLPHIEWLIKKRDDMQANAASLSTHDRKQLDSIIKQIDECREYHDQLHVIADQQIAFDLDDGVVVNYAKFGKVLSPIK